MADQKGAEDAADTAQDDNKGPDPEVTKWQEKARRYEAQVTDYEKRFKDIDPERFQAALEENRILQRQLAEKDGTPEKIEEVIEREKTELEKRYASKYEELEQKLNNTVKENRYLRVTKEMMTQAANYFNSKELDLLEPLIDRFCDWSQEEERIIIKDEKGHIRYSKANPRELMTKEEFFSELVDRYPALAIPKGRSGTMRSGEVNGNASSSANITREQYLAMTPQERASLPNNEELASKIFLKQGSQ